MLKLSALVRLLKPWSFKRGRGLTTAVIPLGFGGRKANYALNRPAAVRASVCWMNTDRLLLVIPPLTPPMNPTSVALINPYYRSSSNPLVPSPATFGRLFAHCHRRRYPTRTDVFRPGDPAGTLYYVISGSVSIITEEDDGRELVLGYFGPGEFVGEMGLFIQSDVREVILRTRVQCELAEISYERLYQLFEGSLIGDATQIVYAIGAQLSRRLLDTSRKAGRLAFLDVTDRITRTLHDLTREPEAMSHPDGTQLRVSRQELARLVGCSREMAGRVLKKLQADGKLHARGKTVVVYGTRWRATARAPHDVEPLRTARPASRRRPAQRLADRRRRRRRPARRVGLSLRNGGSRRTHRCHRRQRPPGAGGRALRRPRVRSEEHTSELQSLMRISYAVFCLKKKKTHNQYIQY